jgi:hypothetical protein
MEWLRGNFVRLLDADVERLVTRGSSFSCAIIDSHVYPAHEQRDDSQVIFAKEALCLEPLLRMPLAVVTLRRAAVS